MTIHHQHQHHHNKYSLSDAAAASAAGVQQIESITINSEILRDRNKALWASYGKITTIVALYWFVSITMVFLNKQILAGSQFSLDAPLFITWFQCVFTVAITLIGSTIASFVSSSNSKYSLLDNIIINDNQKKQHHENKKSRISSTFTLTSYISNVSFRWKIALKVLPLSIVFVAMISFNNLCLKNVGVAFYFIGRSLTTVFNVILTYIMLSRTTSPKAIACCLAIVLGFILGMRLSLH